jgi:hypothetical protein
MPSALFGEPPYAGSAAGDEPPHAAVATANTPAKKASPTCRIRFIVSSSEPVVVLAGERRLTWHLTPTG